MIYSCEAGTLAGTGPLLPVLPGDRQPTVFFQNG